MQKRKRFRIPVILAVICCLSGTAVTQAGAAVNSTAAQEPLPRRYSSAENGYVTPIKAQQSQDCALYASMGTFESALLRAGYNISDMSTDHLNVWATTRSNGKGWIRTTSDSSYGSATLGYLTSWQGGVLQSDIPGFKPSDYPYGDMVPVDLARYGVTAARVLSKDNPDEVKRAIFEHGGIYSAYAHAAACMSHGSTAYFMPDSYAGWSQGHAVEVVGWDDDYPKENFENANVGEIPQNNGAWLIKGSWGKNNELGGYYWLSYEDKYILHSRFKPSYGIEQFEEINENKKLIQNEIYGATYDFGYIHDTVATFMNHFEFSDEFFTLDKIIFKTDNAGAAYTLHYVPDKNGAPDSNRANWTELSRGIVPYSGYICDDISDFAVPHRAGSVAVTLDCSALNGSASIGVDEWLINGDNEMVFINESEPGQSYLMTGSKPEDLLDWYRENNDNDELGGTFVIKALAVNNGNFLLGDVNGDGKVNINDATDIQRHLAMIQPLTGQSLRAADFDRNDLIDINDATAVQRFIAGA